MYFKTREHKNMCLLSVAEGGDAKQAIMGIIKQSPPITSNYVAGLFGEALLHQLALTANVQSL